MNKEVKSRFMPQVSCGYLVSLIILRAFYFTALLCLIFRLSLLQQVTLVLLLSQMGHPWMRRHCNSNVNMESV